MSQLNLRFRARQGRRSSQARRVLRREACSADRAHDLGLT